MHQDPLLVYHVCAPSVNERNIRIGKTYSLLERWFMTSVRQNPTKLCFQLMHIRWSYFTHGHISALLTLCEWNPRIFLKGKFWEALVLSLFWARAIWWANSRVAFDARLIWHRRHAWQWSSKSAGAGRPGHWPYNDDVIKWKHFPCHWPFVRGIHRSPVNSPHKGQWSGALIFFLICAWINGWVNNGEAGDLRRHRTHYNVTVLYGWERQFKGTSLISYMSLWAHTHLSYWIDLRQHEDASTFFISQHLAALVFFNPSSSKAKTGLFYIMNTMVTDVLVMQEAKASAVMGITKFC